MIGLCESIQSKRLVNRSEKTRKGKDSTKKLMEFLIPILMRASLLPTR